MAEPSIVVLGMVTNAILAAFANKATKTTDAVWAKLRAEPTKVAFMQALGMAIHRYATAGARLSLARPLLLADGPLTDPDVARELARLVEFRRMPDAELIGQRWQAALAEPWPTIDFTAEAERLLKEMRLALRATDAFRSVFDSESLDAIASSAVNSANALAAVETQLADLSGLLAAGFRGLTDTFAAATPPLRGDIRDYSRLLEEKTRGFVGRRFVFSAVDRFVADNPSGYFFVRGEPGIGKTALAAQLVKTRGLVHHFNVQSEGITRAETFLRNVCAQLVSAFALDYRGVPAEAGQDAGFLNQVLDDVAGKVEPTRPVVIVVDALDEADPRGQSHGSNILYLPASLPPGIFILATTRDVSLRLRVECEQETLDIEEDSSGNLADIRDYLEGALDRSGIRDYIDGQHIDERAFVDFLEESSQGNFMYLRHVLPEIERGAYAGLDLSGLPVGLQNYYEDHWRRMRGQDEDGWFQYKLPIVMALTEVAQPVPIELVEEFSGVQSRARIQGVLDDWAPFLHTEYIDQDGVVETRYRIYHASFHDFIAAKDQVKAERVDLMGARKRIADALYKRVGFE